jgi:23S rRNA (uracil1939-C5)-methyltransferase
VRAGDRLTLACVDLDDEGAGVSAERVHVAGALPGESVAATVEHVSAHTGEAWARLERVETPSPARQATSCAAFGACGGCVLQHLDYDAQRAWKQARVERALRGAGLDVAVDACVASPRPLGYRNNSKLVAGGAAGRLLLGAYAPRSHAVVDLTGCRIAQPPLDDTARALRELFEARGVRPYDERALTGDLRYVVLRANASGQVLATWIVSRAVDDGTALARAFRAARPEVAGVVEHVNRTRGNALFESGGPTRTLDGASSLEDTVPVGAGVVDRSVRVRLSAGAFFQANRDVAGLAYAAIAHALEPRAGEQIVDAYCGVGGIALTLAPASGQGGSVLGIENNAAAVNDAIASAALNGVENARFVTADVAARLAAVEHADLVVVNPPRKGCAPGVLEQLLRLAPRAVAYLSCDPDTLARDLAWLAAHGYRARSVTPFDMLPHTPHIEALAIIEPTAR